MRPLTQLPREEALRLDGLFFDLDDTFLDHGKLTEASYSSLFRLQEAGLRLIALTGRPAAWAELAARLWPVEAAIGENGALAYVYSKAGVERVDPVSPPERSRRLAALADLVRETRSAVPELVPADDVAGRISDYTFDIGEHQRPNEDSIARAIAIAERHGARTARSSVHLHFTFDRVDKATGALAYLASRGLDTTRALGRFAFIGDSENDASCFAGFRTTFGVANLRGSFSLLPRYQSRAEAGRGFVEVAETLVALRSEKPPHR